MDDKIAKTTRQQELEQQRWFVCKANPQRMTHSLRDALEKQGLTYYMALCTKLVRRGKEMVEVQESLLGSYFFVRSSFKDALRVKTEFGLDYQYVRDTHKQLLWVQDHDFENFRQFIVQAGKEADYSADLYAVGDPVIVTRGPLCGIEGILVEVDERHNHLIVKIPMVIAASIKITKSCVRKNKKILELNEQ